MNKAGRDASAPREAFGVRGIPALSKAAECAALHTLRDFVNKWRKLRKFFSPAVDKERKKCDG